MESSTSIAYIALGSNMGDRHEYLEQAIEYLEQHPQITLAGKSSIYETEPVGFTDQDAFLNMVIAVRTSIRPHELLHTMLSIELKLGRTRDIHWGPRTIDLDLLVYGDTKIESEDLHLPHPRMEERAFVMIPFVEVIAQCMSDQERITRLQHILEGLGGKEGVKLWRKAH
ncbi:2-amino-4-hydroxy-6-hydroxymethyldihydropteridine diphosphokinase [Paenibacillus sp. N1-5-1-14]|uniref:2-amino-4-hydroxy-6- hydroxymethyldihydropteridine diphosphokinase n=1 Tax=Paenibacillus radicibacter TaxID=2972488 RepID=UPI0021591D9E|nr:2-amino-4-hydroxy-6-hydroxymethyldihydropteridine diphosphokinase [Paenibacillus radicibacter]MCR8645836.1 2-amino-4-hydroxy-6-hydroxymethyldihydropteridine diphosphokinase [Paenibacillus radicibacter]